MSPVRTVTYVSGPDQNWYGGEGGIRTHGRGEPTHAFQACALNHSATSPRWKQHYQFSRNRERPHGQKAAISQNRVHGAVRPLVLPVSWDVWRRIAGFARENEACRRRQLEFIWATIRNWSANLRARSQKPKEDFRKWLRTWR